MDVRGEVHVQSSEQIINRSAACAGKRNCAQAHEAIAFVAVLTRKTPPAPECDGRVIEILSHA